jgi:hypothetical protein
MIPFNSIRNGCWRRDDTPLITRALKANQLSAIVLLVGKAILSEKSQGSRISLLGLTNVLRVERKDVSTG